MKYSINKKTAKSKKGFTLVELIVVLAIIGVLSGIVTPTILSKVDEAKKQTDIANAASIAMAVKTEIAENKTYTLDTNNKVTDIDTLLSGYFDAGIPKCKSEKDASFAVYIDNNKKISVKVGSNTYYPFSESETKGDD